MAEFDDGIQDEPTPNLDSVDLLALWRTVSIDSLRPDMLSRLGGVLIALTRAAKGADRVAAALLLAQGRDASAWLDLAIFHSPSKNSVFGAYPRAEKLDCHCSCLLAAARLGSSWAAALLTQHLAYFPSEGADPAIRLHLLLELASRALPRTADPTAVVEKWGVLPHIEGDLEEIRGRQRGSTLPNSSPAEPSREQSGDRLCVLREVPEPGHDKESKVLIERYSVLVSAVPLAPMPDPDKLAAALDAEFPWAREAIETVHSELQLVWRLAGDAFRLPPILLTGLPGIGKSTFARRLCELSGVPHWTLFAGGSTDNRGLAGTSRGWSNAYPSLPLVVIRRHLIGNPTLVVEEIDKSAGGDRNGRMADTLALMLDPSLSRSWLDDCLQVAANISKISWILSANRLDRVAPAIRSRCRIIEFPRPRPQDFEALLAGIYRDLAGEYGVEQSMLPELPNDALESLKSGFRQGRLQARQLANLVRRLMAEQSSVERLEVRH